MARESEQVAGKRRKASDVRARVASYVDVPLETENVRPLAKGFFFMQRMRAAKHKAGK